MNDKMKSLLNTPVSLVKGLKVTMTNLLRSKTTVKYPEVMPGSMGQSQPTGDDEFALPYEIAPRFRGLHGLTRDLITGDHNCIGCMACAKVCPDDLISMDLEKREGHSGRFPVTFTVNIGPCCFCGLCAEVCPTPMRAIVMTDLFEWASYRRDGANLVLNRQDLERHGDYEVERRSAGRIWEEDGKLKAVLPEEAGNPYFQFAPEYDAERAGKSLAEVQADQPSPREMKAQFEAEAAPEAAPAAAKPAEAAPEAASPAAPPPTESAAPPADDSAELRANLMAVLQTASVEAPAEPETMELSDLDSIEDRKLRGQAKSALRKLQRSLGLVD